MTTSAVTARRAELAGNLERVRARIAAACAAAGRAPAELTLIAVTKNFPAMDVVHLAALGVRDIGENRDQEASAKVAEVARHGVSVRWHFVGRLQRNKVKVAAPHVHLWQSIDRQPLAAEVARRAPGARVLVQVNVAGAAQQGGCPPDDVPTLVAAAQELGLVVDGLMAIGPQGPDGEVRAAFRVVRDLADRLGLPERSMGMSGDLEQAVAEGATMVRVGTALFGPRRQTGGVGK